MRLGLTSRRCRRLFWLFLLCLSPCLALGAQTQESLAAGKPVFEPYLVQYQVQRQEGWLKREIRRFRSYPHLDRAYQLMEAGRLPEARTELEKFLQIDPLDLKARFTYLLVLYRMKDYQESVRQANLILQEQPQFASALIYRGLSHQALGRRGEALKDFQAAAKAPGLSPDDRLFALNMLADLAIQQKDFALALEALGNLAPAGKGFNLYFRQGLALEGLGRLAEADNAYRLALKEASLPAERLRAYGALAETAKKRRDWQGAQEALLAARELDPQNPQPLRALAELACDRQDYQESARCMRQALALKADPGDREFLVYVLEALHDYRGMTEELTRLLPETQAPEDRYRLYTALGHAYGKWGKYAQAAAAFREAAKIKEDPAALEALARTLEREGRPAAAAYYREMLRRQPSAQLHLKLGVLLEKTGDTAAAVSHLEKAAAGDLPRDLKGAAYKQLGLLRDKLGNFTAARAALEKALNYLPQDPALYQALAETAAKLNNWEEALAYQKKALELTARPGAAGELQERLGVISFRLGRYQEAAAHFRQALTAGRDGWSLRQNLGMTLYKLHQWPAALEQFRRALNYRRTPQSLIYLGHVYKELNQPGLAIHYLSEALPGAPQLEQAEQRDLYNALGYLYAAAGEDVRAAAFWSKSLALQYGPVIALSLAGSQRRLGQLAEAQEALEKLAPAPLPPKLQAQRLDELAEVFKKEGQWEQALDALFRANAMEATAPRHYGLGLVLQKLQRPEEALGHFQKAVSLDPPNLNYRTALGYAYYKLKRHAEAAQIFETVLRQDPDYLALYEDLGYIYMHEVDNDRAVAWFKRAIDNESLYPVHSPEEAEKLRQDLYRLRKEVSKITNRYDFTAYLSYQTARRQQSVAPGSLGGGAVPSQGGVEFAYQPPEIGFRDERIFQVFTRILWNIQPRSLRFDEDSFQGGVGLRYKPLKTQNLYLWGERLFKIGDKAIDDWLLRILYSWDYGYDLQPGRRRWNYTYLFLDGAYFTKTPGTWAYYGEFRQGVTFNLNDTFLITPHLILDARYQDPLRAGSSYLEEGVGVSLKYLFLQTRYEVHRASFEVLAYYKHGNFLDRTLQVSGSKYDGFFLTGIFHF